jgi:hypothetical protein
VFPRPVNFAAVEQSSVGMKNSQKLSSKTSSETRLVTLITNAKARENLFENKGTWKNRKVDIVNRGMETKKNNSASKASKGGCTFSYFSILPGDAGGCPSVVR